LAAASSSTVLRITGGPHEASSSKDRITPAVARIESRFQPLKPINLYARIIL